MDLNSDVENRSPLPLLPFSMPVIKNSCKEGIGYRLVLRSSEPLQGNLGWDSSISLHGKDSDFRAEA
jgi:hypothetical protein